MGVKDTETFAFLSHCSSDFKQGFSYFACQGERETGFCGEKQRNIQ